MGILSSALGGVAKAGVASAQQVSTDNRRHEQGLLASTQNHEQQLERDTVQYNRQEAKDKLNHQRSIMLANIRKSTSGKQRSLKANYDSEGNFKGTFDPNTGEYNEKGSNKPSVSSLLNNAPGGKAHTPEQIEQNRAQSDQIAAQEKEKVIANEVAQLVPDANTAERNTVWNIVQKLNNNEALTWDEKVKYSALLEKSSNNKPEETVISLDKKMPNNNSRQGHNQTTNRFLNQAINRNNQDQ